MGKVTSIRTARRQTAKGRAGTPIEKLLAGARLKLIETGTRNRLIHTPRGATRSRALAITGNAADQVFAKLVRENKPLRILAAEDIADIGRDAAAPETPRLAAPGTNCRNDLRISLSPGLLHKRLHAMHRAAKTAEEERGVNILFLALGFLRWYEDEESGAPRAAPLILLPVYLGRDAKRSTFNLRLREDAIAPIRPCGNGCAAISVSPCPMSRRPKIGSRQVTSMPSPLRLPPNGDGRSTPTRSSWAFIPSQKCR